MRIAICDDDAQGLNQLRSLVEEYVRANPRRSILVRRFHSSSDMIESYKNDVQKCDLYILSADSLQLNGINLGKHIRWIDGGDSNPAFSSGLENQASYAEQSPQLLFTPITKDLLFPALERIFEKSSRAMDTNLLVKVKSGLACIRIHEIVFMECAHNTITYHLSTGKTMSASCLRKPFKQYAGQYLQDRRFIKPHASCLVNMDYIQLITATGFKLSNGEVIPITKREYSKAKKQFTDYMLAKNELIAAIGHRP